MACQVVPKADSTCKGIAFNVLKAWYGYGKAINVDDQCLLIRLVATLQWENGGNVTMGREWEGRGGENYDCYIYYSSSTHPSNSDSLVKPLEYFVLAAGSTCQPDGVASVRPQIGDRFGAHLARISSYAHTTRCDDHGPFLGPPFHVEVHILIGLCRVGVRV
jgi:hypothetical protein